MKALVIATLGLMVSMAAHADDGVVSLYSAKGSDSSVRSCPEISAALVQSPKNSIEIAKAGLRLSNGFVIVVENISHSRECQSDIICNGLDTGIVEQGTGKGMIVSFTHNNNGEYPTTDTAGFKYVDLITGSQTCSYELTQLPAAK